MNKNIREVLNEAGILYQTSNMRKEKPETDMDAYFINLSINNEIIHGGIVEDDADKHVTIIFFASARKVEKKTGYLKLLELINDLNKECRYGNFVYDDEEITYSLSIPVISSDKISKYEFKYYFDRCLSTVKEAFGDIQDELRKNSN